MKEKIQIVVFFLMVAFVLGVVFTPYIIVFITGSAAYLALYAVWAIPIAIALFLFYLVIKLME